MNNIKSIIDSLSKESIAAANEIYADSIGGLDGDYIPEITCLLWDAVKEFVEAHDGSAIRETYNGDEMEIFAVEVDDWKYKGWIPSVRTDSLDAPASTIDPFLAVPTKNEALAWGISDALAWHILDNGIKA